MTSRGFFADRHRRAETRLQGGGCEPTLTGRFPSRSEDLVLGGRSTSIREVGMPTIGLTGTPIARNVLVIVGVFLVLYVIYLLRKPISWLIIAAFLAVALAGPVNFFQRYMKRGLAISLVYFGLLAIPIGLGAVLVPPIVNQVSDVATTPELRPRRRGLRPQEQDAQRPQREIRHHAEALRRGRQAARARPATPPGRCATSASASSARSSPGVTILILSIFMVAAGPQMDRDFIRMQRPEHAERIERRCGRSRTPSATTWAARCCRRRSPASPRSSS